MCKRFLFLLALVVLAGISTQAFAVGFPDVTGTYYETAFTYLSENGAVQGYPDGRGAPTSMLNRVEALKVLLSVRSEDKARVQRIQKHMPPLPLFADVNQKSWYAPYIEAAFEKGMVQGYPDGTFRPGYPLRTEEAIALLMRLFGEEGENDGAELSPYIENRDGEWFTSSVNAAIKKNLILHAGTLRLGMPITRGQFFDMVYRLHSIKSANKVAYDGPEPPPPAPQRIVVQPRQPVVRSVSPRPTTSVASQARLSNPYASEKYFSISMPSLGIKDLVITHPSDPFSSNGVLSVLQYGVGHLFGYPGAGGKIMVYGHSSGYPWDVSKYTKIFRRVNELNPGDKIYVTYGDKLITYEVTYEETVPARDTSAFNDDGLGEELILYTCWPPDSISQRYLVHARPVETVALR